MLFVLGHKLLHLLFKPGAEADEFLPLKSLVLGSEFLGHALTDILGGVLLFLGNGIILVQRGPDQLCLGPSNGHTRHILVGECLNTIAKHRTKEKILVLELLDRDEFGFFLVLALPV